MTFPRITIDLNQLGGSPCIRHQRIPVSMVVGLVTAGITNEEILAYYPDLELADIDEALRFAAAQQNEMK